MCLREEKENVDLMSQIIVKPNENQYSEWRKDKSAPSVFPRYFKQYPILKETAEFPKSSNKSDFGLFVLVLAFCERFSIFRSLEITCPLLSEHWD